MATYTTSYHSFSSTIPEYHSIKFNDNDVCLLDCRVCNNVFSLQGERVPRLLHCGHTVCHTCLTQLPIHSSAILCPFDRQPSLLNDSGVWSLNKNFALLELQEKLVRSQNTVSTTVDAQDKDKQLESTITRCEEDDRHAAVVYCTVCLTSLCLSCSHLTHSTKTLSRHKRVPLSEKPKTLYCPIHTMHVMEFVCNEESCRDTPLMCFICKEGRHANHKHSLLEEEAASVRQTICSAQKQTKAFGIDVTEFSRKLANAIVEIEGSMTFAQAPDGTTVMQEIPGTAHQARTRVTQYFSDLHEHLERQQVVAMTTVDTHIHERLRILRQEQDDLGALLSHISAVCSECQSALHTQDNAKLLLARNEVSSLLDTITKQQQQFSELPDHLSLDTAIPITFTRDNRVHIGARMEMRVVILGLDGSGKTSILFKLKQNEFVQTIPTIGFNVETIEYNDLHFTIWDVGGQVKLRPLWKHYYHNTQAVIFVIDSSCRHRLQEAYHELNTLLQEKDLRDASLLVLCNKQDCTCSLSVDDLTQQLNLFKLCCSRSWHITACDAKSGSGLHDGLEWLACQMIATMSDGFS